ncbi:hypothetical protein LDENG_00244170 [Lucifuga dentata]|nr:hypothetical protein LDENG_00244170 [Lucifuga dentata]
MSRGRKISCVLCRRSEETKITGPLSTKDSVTAHQNCLLYSSGICCQFSPQFDDLFGFSVEDVVNEVNRGKKLLCYRCKRNRATAGCEVRRCRKSFHYPCAVEDDAEGFEDADKGRYGLYCSQHKQQIEESRESVSGSDSSCGQAETSEKSCQPGPSGLNGFARKKEDGNLSIEVLPTDVVMMNCGDHKTSSRREKVGGTGRDAVAGPSFYSGKRVKRRLPFSDRQEETTSKQKFKVCKNRIFDDSSDSDDNGDHTHTGMIPPIDSDLDDSQNTSPNLQSNRESVEIPVGSTSGDETVDENRNDNKDEDKHSDAESESLLPDQTSAVPPCSQTDQSSEQRPGNCLTSVERMDVHTARPSVPQQSSTEPPRSSPDRNPVDVTSSPPHSSSTPVAPSALQYSATRSARSSSSSPGPLPKVSEASFASAMFWKNCNKAGCTQGIFTDFINLMNNVSAGIQSDEASQEGELQSQVTS